MTTQVVPPSTTAAAATTSQAAAVATADTITATLPAAFDSRNLPADVRDRYNHLITQQIS